ncbi:unnamed protein product [Amoebophrya sp. A25]|nr:unnamed protein product [Amoebophrya sp. A25]|eukprot:GSA25T00022105001.1
MPSTRTLRIPATVDAIGQGADKAYSVSAIVSLRPQLSEMEDSSGAVKVPLARSGLTKTNSSNGKDNGWKGRGGGDNYSGAGGYFNRENSGFGNSYDRSAYGKGAGKDLPNGKNRAAGGAESWRPLAPAALVHSEQSWAKRNAQRRNHVDADTDEDAEVTRKLKGHMNKLTDANFENIYGQIKELLAKEKHVIVLVHEVFQKAITQHFFIDLYTKLTVELSKYLESAEYQGEQLTTTFKKILVNEVQQTFEDSLTNSKAFSDKDMDTHSDEYEEFVKKKTRITGNVKFIANLLREKMIASRLFIDVSRELLMQENELTLELLCILCEASGSMAKMGVVDNFQRNELYPKLTELSKSKNVKPRIRFKILDLVEKTKK